MAESAALSLASHQDVPGWRVAFDLVADELRGALAWAARSPEQRPAAYRLALGLAELTFRRGMPGESQRRYEQAAELAPDDLAAADGLAQRRRGRGVTTRRHRRVAPPSRRPPTPPYAPVTGPAPRPTWPATPS